MLCNGGIGVATSPGEYNAWRMPMAESLQMRGAGMAVDEDAQSLMEDPDEALRRWYQTFMAPANDESTLTGGPLPPLSQIGEIFDQWFERRRADLRTALCEKLHYAQLHQHKRESLEITTIAVVSAALISSHLAGQVDPVATAVLLMSRRSLDRLCDDSPAANAGH